MADEATLKVFLGIIDCVFRWDGWRAIAAIGTFLAVWVALGRDIRADRRATIKEAHFIGAIIVLAQGADILAEKYEAASRDPNPTQVKSAIDLYNRVGGVDPIISTLQGIRPGDCPTIEVMTTCTVLLYALDRIKSSYENMITSSRDGKVLNVPSLSTYSSTLKSSIEDLEQELRVVSGRYYDLANLEGHRRNVKNKINGTIRMRAIKSLPKLIFSILTGREHLAQKLNPPGGAREL
jgi:hypothetical protein